MCRDTGCSGSVDCGCYVYRHCSGSDDCLEMMVLLVRVTAVLSREYDFRV